MSDKIVVADDSATMRKMVQRALTSAGVDPERIVLATNGREALEAVEAQDPCLVVSDVNMPEMDGRELLRELARRGRLDRMPAVMVTSVSATRVLLDLTRLGASEVVRKPFHPTELGSVLARYLAKEEPDVVENVAPEPPPQVAATPRELPYEMPIQELMQAFAPSEGGPPTVAEAPAPPSQGPDVLDQAVVRTMADLAFVDAQRTSIVLPSRSVLYRARVHLTHPAPGQLELLATRQVAEELATNLVGEPAADDLACLDALGELANVVAGQLRPLESEDVAGFGLPQLGVLSPGTGPESHRAFCLDGDPASCLFVQLFEAA